MGEWGCQDYGRGNGSIQRLAPKERKPPSLKIGFPYELILKNNESSPILDISFSQQLCLNARQNVKRMKMYKNN